MIVSDELATQISESGLFDAEWYVSSYSDVRSLHMDPLEHFLWIGGLMGRSPGPRFDLTAYLESYPDVRASGMNALVHYVRSGHREGRKIVPVEVRATKSAAEVLGHIGAAALDGMPKRMFASYDRELEDRFMRCVAALRQADPAALAAIRVSIVMPTYNRGALIGRAIDSVRAQSHANWELIIADDGSTDDTFRIVAGYAHDARIRLVKQNHKGVSAARNIGLREATGEWVFYLDSDNRWSTTFLASMLAYLEAIGSDCGYSGIAVEDECEEVTGYRGEPFDWEFCLKGNYVDLNAYCHRRRLFTELGGFDESLRRMVDWDLILRYSKNRRVSYAPFIGCYYRDGASDASRISVSQPIAYRSVVQTKNRLGQASPAQIARKLSLRFAIKIPAPFDKRSEWGDFHYAESLKGALERLGHVVTIDFLGQWYDRPVSHDQIVLVLRGLTEYKPRPGHVNVLWNISHPDQVSYSEYESYDLAYVASASYPVLLQQVLPMPAMPLLQCADPARFSFRADARAPGDDVLFVGNSRNTYREIVRWAVEAGAPLAVYGTRWGDFIDSAIVRGANIDNRSLGDHYASARVVLNDHWESMRDFGFVSNRIFDVLACGGRLISDALPGIDRLFGAIVPQVGSAAELAAALPAPCTDDLAQRRDLSARVLSAHSFDARAKVVLNDILVFLGLPAVHDDAFAGVPAESGVAARRTVGLLMQKGRRGPTSSGYIRLLAPLSTDAAQCRLDLRVLAGADDPAIADCAAVVVQRVAVEDIDTANGLVEKLRAAGKALFVDNDDAFCLLDDHHPERAKYLSKDAAMRRLMSAADEVWFSTAALREVYAADAPRARVVGNVLDPRLWRNYRKARRPLAGDGVLSLVYMGTPTHDSDFSMILPAIDRVAEEFPGRVRVTSIGALRHPPQRDWLTTLAPPLDLSDYPRFVRWLAAQGPFDAGLAPLLDTPFNACKSDIKFLDYSALGILSLVSDVTAYAGTTSGEALAVPVANNTQAWYEALRALLLDRSSFEPMAARAAAHVWNNRSDMRPHAAVERLVR